VEGRVGVAEAAAVAVAKGVLLPEPDSETLNVAVEVLEPEPEPLPVILPVLDPEVEPVTE
jgi:hypothetical protein